ncbi:hypothetical protein GCM10009648_44190 [Tsukamurella spumae]
MAYNVQLESFQEFMIKERSSLRDEVAAEAQTIELVTGQNIQAGDTIYIGTTKLEGCERAVVATVDDETTVNLVEPLIRAHEGHSAVTAVHGDTIRVFRSTSKGGPFSQLAERAIDPDQISTWYRDPDGSESFWYRYTYVNQAGSYESEASVPVQGSSYGNYASLREIREEAGFLNAVNLGDTLVAQCRLNAQNELNAAFRGVLSVAIPFAPVPPIIHTLTVQLAAALLLQATYPGSSALWKDRLSDVRVKIKAIQNGDSSITDENGNDVRGAD